MKRALVTIACSLLAAVFLLPVAMTCMASFMSSAELSVVFSDGHAFRWIPYKVTLENYWELLFASEVYLKTFWNSMFIALAATALQVGVSLIVGHMMAWARFKGRKLLVFLYICVMLTPFQVTLLPNYMLSKELGLYNTLWALILPAAFAPLGGFLVRQFASELPRDVVEAAYIDTSSNLKVIFAVTAPNVKAGLVTVAALSFAENWNMVEQPLILLEDEWLYPLSLRLDSLIGVSAGISFSGAVLFMAPAVLLYLLFESELVEGLKHMRL